MSGPTANLPLGLLDALGIKSGSYPNNLLESIYPTFSLFELLAAAGCEESIGAQINTAGVALQALATVPQGETWMVAYAGAEAVLIAGELIDFSVVVLDTIPVLGGGTHVARVLGATNRLAAAGVARVCAGSVSPFWMTTGQQIGINVERWTSAGTISVPFTCRIHRCRR